MLIGISSIDAKGRYYPKTRTNITKCFQVNHYITNMGVLHRNYNRAPARKK